MNYSELQDEDFQPKFTFEWPKKWKVVTGPIEDCGCK